MLQHVDNRFALVGFIFLVLAGLARALSGPQGDSMLRRRLVTGLLAMGVLLVAGGVTVSATSAPTTGVEVHGNGNAVGCGNSASTNSTLPANQPSRGASENATHETAAPAARP
jgi:hypothetical protein